MKPQHKYLMELSFKVQWYISVFVMQKGVTTTYFGN